MGFIVERWALTAVFAVGRSDTRSTPLHVYCDGSLGFGQLHVAVGSPWKTRAEDSNQYCTSAETGSVDILADSDICVDVPNDVWITAQSR